MHCSSLGEFEQGRPVLEMLRQRTPGCRIILSFFSPSGYETREGLSRSGPYFYLPLDSPGNARQFVDLIKPDLVLWVKYDYWYYFLVELKKRNIPTLLISGVFRPDQPFFHWYGRLHRYMLECFTHLFVQTDTSKTLLGRLRLTDQVSVSGDTRFDRVIEIAEGGAPLPQIEAFAAPSRWSSRAAPGGGRRGAGPLCQYASGDPVHHRAARDRRGPAARNRTAVPPCGTLFCMGEEWPGRYRVAVARGMA
ncbi:3-deoxy-D-manno-octulosonic acid transferase [Puia sp. P3]|uniref:3-deoxy-D-manno-octulosonic acid transferase n=1 Tax=Puia sp. P3 TaxID=3423952 RepID=UPI003D66A9F7